MLRCALSEMTQSWCFGVLWLGAGLYMVGPWRHAARAEGAAMCSWLMQGAS